MHAKDCYPYLFILPVNGKVRYLVIMPWLVRWRDEETLGLDGI